MMEKESHGFIFEQKEGSTELPAVRLDLGKGMASIHPAYLKNNDGSKGKLAGYYFTTPGTKIMSLRQCLPWKFGSNYSSTLNGRWKIYTKKDGKDRHVTGKECTGCKLNPIRDICYTWEFLMDISVKPALTRQSLKMPTKPRKLKPRSREKNWKGIILS